MLSVFSMLIMIIGLILWLIALKYRSPKMLSISYKEILNPLKWIPVWKMRNYFTTSRGYWYHLIGTTLIVISGLIGAIFIFH